MWQDQKHFLPKKVQLEPIGISRLPHTGKCKAGELSKGATAKAEAPFSVKKITAMTFWDFEDVIFIDYLQKGAITTGQYYADIEWKKSRVHSERSKVVELGHKLLPYLTYSED
ncbi:hypothetical protein Trydic_g21051 [Trypoxylus dichotomus]